MLNFGSLVWTPAVKGEFMANGSPKVDLIITGDRVIDPSSGLDGPAQIHVTNGKIVSLSDDLSLQSADRHIDAEKINPSKQWQRSDSDELS